MDSLREHYRHLHSVLDESVRTIDSMEHDDTELERVLLTGDDITKLLKRAYSDSQEKQVSWAHVVELIYVLLIYPFDELLRCFN